MISLDVNTVRTDTIIYRYKKSFFLFDFALDNVFAAKYEKNPASSRYTESIVMDMNSATIFNGFTAEFSASFFPIDTKSFWPHITSDNAPARATTQYVSTDNFPILIFGKNNMPAIMRMQAITQITILIVKTLLLIGKSKQAKHKASANKIRLPNRLSYDTK